MTPPDLSPLGAKSTLHTPVMVNEVIAALAPRRGETYVDATFGAGGYSQAILKAADCRVIAIDRDPEAVLLGQRLERQYPQRFHILLGCFGAMENLLHQQKITNVHGVVLDLGVSSIQLDHPERGFSFRYDGPLDMRMGKAGLSAADYVNTLSAEDLTTIFFDYGEERLARKIARQIVKIRQEHPLTRTSQLADIARAVAPRTTQGIDPATRVFQALRIKVNAELEELDKVLHAAEKILFPQGRIVVVSFHSLEDRCVKMFLRQRSGSSLLPSRHQPAPEKAPERSVATFTSLYRRVIQPSAQEIAINPRARSARLRAALRTTAPLKQERAGSEEKRL